MRFISKVTSVLLRNKKWNPRCAFVIGCGHSGTSLMIYILSEHNAIYAVPNETSLFLQNFDDYKIKSELKRFDDCTLQANKQVWVEKTPIHLYAIEQIYSHRPNTKFIAMTRDPRNVACSIKARGYSFEEGLTRWINDNTQILLNRGSASIKFVKLEDLVKSPNEIINEILGFLGLEYQDLTNYHMRKKDWYTNKYVDNKPENGFRENHELLRNWQINQPLFDNSNRYKKEMTTYDVKVWNKYIQKIKPIAMEFGYKI